MRMAAPHDDIERHAAGLQRAPYGAARVEASGAAQSAVAADPRCQLARQRLHDASQLGQFER
jgi:hypothetical protein